MTMAAQGQVRVISIKVVSDSNKAFRQFERDAKRAASGINSMSNSLDLFKRLYFTLMAGRGIGYLKELADGWQLNRDRLKNFVGTAEEALRVQNDLYQVAQRNRTDINSLGESYNRLGFATKDMNLSARELTEVVGLLDLTFKVSGSSAQETSNTMIQLAQGLGAGALRGDEFRSVSEQNIVLLGLLARELGVSNGQLKDMAAQGKITSDVVLKALINNSGELRKQFENINPTLEQTGTTLRNFLGKSIDTINRQFGITAAISAAAAAGLAFVSQNGELVGDVLRGLAFGLLPALILGLGKATLAMKAFTASNPWLLAISVTLGLIATYWEDITRWIKLASNTLEGWIVKFRRWTDSNPAGVVVDKNAEKEYSQQLKRIADKRKELQDQFAKEDKAKEMPFGDFKLDSKELDAFRKKVEEFQATTPGTGKNKFKLLNASDAVKDLDLYKRKLKEIELTDLKDQFTQGKISLIDYQDKLDDLIYKYREVESAQDQMYMGLTRGLGEYAESARDIGENFRTFITGTFGNLEDAIVNFVSKGKFEFKSFADSVIADLARIAIRQNITAPLASSLSGFFSPGASAATPTGISGGNGSFAVPMANAKGNAFHRGQVQAFATGGIINSPTLFPMKRGLGLMGEAGPEAIMPLTRGKDGKLGVQASGGNSSNVVVNVINQAGAEVSAQERTGANGEKQIDVIVKQAVKRAMGDGSFDKDFATHYGMNRKGRV